MKLEIYKDPNLINEKTLNQIKDLDDEGIANFIFDPFTFNAGIVKDEENVIGFGLVRVISEFKMVINSDLNKITKAKIIKFLMREALELKKTNEVIVSITKPFDGIEHYASILQKHYDFREDPNLLLRLER